MAQPQRAIPQSKEQLLKSYTKRMKDDVRSMVDNFTEIFKLTKVQSNTRQCTGILISSLIEVSKSVCGTYYDLALLQAIPMNVFI